MPFLIILYFTFYFFINEFLFIYIQSNFLFWLVDIFFNIFFYGSGLYIFWKKKVLDAETFLIYLKKSEIIFGILISLLWFFIIHRIIYNYIAVYWVNAGFDYRFHNFDLMLYKDRFLELKNHYLLYLLFIIFMTGYTSIIEEFIFRGVVIRQLSKFIQNKNLIVFISAMIFGFIHWGAGYFDIFNAFLFGLLTGYRYIKSGNHLGNILFHFMVNILLYLY